MSKRHILKYFISTLLLLALITVEAQEESQEADSVLYKQAYGIRLGIDISRPVIQIVEKQNIGFEITADYRVANRWYIASEIGYVSEPGKEDYFRFHTKGSYAKLGFNYNTYENWLGMSNEIYVGLRYAFSRFQQQLNSYTILDSSHYFDNYTAEPGVWLKDLLASWGELHIGLKVEVLANLFLTAGVHFKKLINEKQPEGFANLYIPGFNKVRIGNNGVGFNYTIAYLIPFKKK